MKFYLNSFILICLAISIIFAISIFYPLYFSNNIFFKYSVHIFNICTNFPKLWKLIKVLFIVFYVFSNYFIFNYIYILINSSSKKIKNRSINNQDFINVDLKLLVGIDKNENYIYIPQKGLYQNILITGTTGSGKTSSAMYPFTEQLISYNYFNSSQKIGLLILDVKGNYYRQVKKYCVKYNRLDDLIVLELGGKYKYNPLNKQNLKASVLANRLKNILLLFSKNNTESYWLDKVEQIFTESIKLCRLYNQNYVTFDEIHKLVTNQNYFNEKIHHLRKTIFNEYRSQEDQYNLSSSLSFFNEEYWKLDERTLSILKSEITRITNLFVSDYEVSKTFCPNKEEENFYGFKDLINTGKIVVLNMNISQYKNLSKIIAAYLKIDFQSEVLSQLSTSIPRRSVAFICDEYHEYVTMNDADFFSQSREAQCINIVSTQSYSSLLNTVTEVPTLHVLLQSFVNKIWYRTDDIFTIEEIQKQLGKEEKEKISRTISENSDDSKYNYVTHSFYSKKSNLSESINKYSQFDYIYDASYFYKNLETFNALAFLSDGINIIPPQKIKLIPYFKER